jgi:hypothetical protein
MIRPKSIAQILAELVVEGGMPLKAVAITGELIAMDARISDYLNGPMKHGSLRVHFESSQQRARRRSRMMLAAA